MEWKFPPLLTFGLSTLLAVGLVQRAWAAPVAPPVQKPGVIVFVAASNHTAPLSRFDKDVLVGGLIKDLGDALARRLSMTARYLVMPSKRAPTALRQGEGDLLCYTRPQWIGEDFQFTQPLIPNSEVVAAHLKAPSLSDLAGLKHQAVGTVLGYRYAEVEAALGPAFKREDAPNMEANLNKLAIGRTAYAITDRLVLREAMRQGLAVREDLVLNQYSAPCALSPKSTLRLTTIQAALKALVDSGEWARILAGYGLQPS